jgi:hypothetical protein
MKRRGAVYRGFHASSGKGFEGVNVGSRLGTSYETTVVPVTSVPELFKFFAFLFQAV